MDLTFDIKNSKGDHVMVALSQYDEVNIRIFTSDRRITDLDFYDVSLSRISGTGYVGGKIIYGIIKILADFLEENDNAVLCFYCDPSSELPRNHTNMLPQQYRSQLFSRMFDNYTKNQEDKFVNHLIKVEDGYTVQYAHFICRKDQEEAISLFGASIISK